MRCIASEIECAVRHRLLLLVVVFVYAIGAQAQGAADLAFLRGFLDKYPNDVELWSNPALDVRLKNLLGNNYTVFIDNMKVNSPLGEYTDVIWTSGNRSQDGGFNAALFLADIKNNQIEIYLLKNSELIHFGESGKALMLEGDAQVVLDNFLAVAAKKPGQAAQ